MRGPKGLSGKQQGKMILQQQNLMKKHGRGFPITESIWCTIVNSVSQVV